MQNIWCVHIQRPYGEWTIFHFQQINIPTTEQIKQKLVDKDILVDLDECKVSHFQVTF